MEEYFIEDKEIKVIETEEYPFVVVAGTEINDYKELIDVPLLKKGYNAYKQISGSVWKNDRI